MHTSDALTRSPVETADKNSTALQEEVESHIAAITSDLPATKPQLEIYHMSQSRNSITRNIPNLVGRRNINFLLQSDLIGQ